MVTVIVAGTDRTCQTQAPARAEIGRRSVRERGQPSTAALTIDIASWSTPDSAVAMLPVRITDRGEPRFSGAVSEAQVTRSEEDDAAGQVRLVCMGALATQAGGKMGDEPWPEETVAERAQRVAAILGAPLVVQGGTAQLVRPMDVDNRPMLAVLAELADSTGGWLFDAPDPATGEPTIYLQALDARKVTGTAVTWDDDAVGAAWDALDPATTWLAEDANPYVPITIDACDILWQPQWVQSADIVNRVRVEYGGDQDNTADAVAEDPASIAEYGTHEARIRSQLVSAADAAELAALILERNARPRWRLESVTVQPSELHPETRAKLDIARPGTRITLTSMPYPAPAGGFPGVLEGWQEEWTGPDPADRTITLYLSDARHSLAVPVWDAEAVEALWNDLEPAADWESDL